MRFDKRWVAHAAGILLLSVAFPASGASSREESRQFYEQALEYIRADSLAEAVIQLRNSLQQDEDNLAARIMLGRMLLQRDEPLARIRNLLQLYLVQPLEYSITLLLEAGAAKPACLGDAERAVLGRSCWLADSPNREVSRVDLPETAR